MKKIESKLSPPIIILGMHRSGTTMFSKIIDESGVFLGKNKEENNESKFFMNINANLLRLAGANWQNPEAFNCVNDFYRNMANKYLHRRFNSIASIYFWGLKRYVFRKQVKNWGWKDPRNCLTISLWLKLFPDAKIVYIYRNPIDVANSLKKRQEKHMSSDSWTIKDTLKSVIRQKSLDFGTTYKYLNIEEGISLWEKYHLEVEPYMDRILTIKYEDILENKEKEMSKVFKYLDLKETFKKSKTYNSIDQNRAYAFINNPSLVDIYYQNKDSKLFKKLRYDNIKV